SSGADWSKWALIMPIVIMAVPMFDTLSVIIIRTKNRKPIYVGDKNHFSHRLVALGMSQRGAVLAIYMVTLCTGLGALLLPHVDTVGAFLILLQTVTIFCVIALLEYARGNGNRNH
ncbi:MAG: undecaprenyl/decaprenyl-phosphate alpha-N-acetylglucosaminyl 1-phosphate transferase, partial [bacterium]